MILARVEKGEPLPLGVSLDTLQLLAANTHFQLNAFARSEAAAAALLARAPTGPLAADARLVLGLSLALQNKFADAIPVFRALEASPVHHDKALLYRSIAAQQAGQNAVAIDALNRLLATAPHDPDWADSALTLIALHLREKNPEAAARGLALLRGNLPIVDNLAGLNTLGLQLGDALLDADAPAGALAAYRTVLPRDELLPLQTRRTGLMQTRLARQKAAPAPSPADAEATRRLEARLKATETALAEITQKPDYDAALYYRIGHAFLLRGGDWEAALALERLLKDHPASPERENAHLELVRAHASAGRLDAMKTAVDRFTQAMPASPQLPPALTVAAQAAATQGRLDLQLQLLDYGLSHFPKAELAEPMLLMQANAYFAATRFAEARASSIRYLATYPDGKFLEDATYLQAMATLVLGQPEAAIHELDAYLARHPEGRFVADARYRLAAADYALGHYPSAQQKLAAWLKDYPEPAPLRGEALSTQGDVLVAQDRLDDALASYRAALRQPLADDLLGYVLDELTRHYQARRDLAAAATLWADFARDHPDHPFVINAAYWIGKLRAKDGHPDDALAQMSAIARRYLADPQRDTVERLLTQIATLLARPPPAAPDGHRPPPPTPAQITTLVAAALTTPETRDIPTVKARVWFTEAEVAALRKDPALHDELLARIADQIPPEALPPALLGTVGDLLLAQEKPAQAKAFYDRLVLHYPRSFYADYGYVGLGEIASRQRDFPLALACYTDAIDRAGARSKLLDATLGRANALLALGRLDDAKILFEQIAANRQWRGPATAQSVYALGDILARRGGPENLAEAQAHFQRVYISYRKHTPWVARAYLRSGETFERLGQLPEALATYREMLADPRLAALPETRLAAARLKTLEAALPAAPAGAAS